MRVFVCFAHEQRPLAREVQTTLRHEGHQVFFDEAELVAGEEFNARIRGEIARAHVFVALLSRRSLEPGSYSAIELGLAEERWPLPHGRVLPVVVDDLDVGALSAYLRSVHVLRPRGHIPAEVARAVAMLSRARRVRNLVELAAAACLLVPLSWLLMDVLSLESDHERRTRLMSDDPDVAWLAGQDVPPWFIDPEAPVVGKLEFFEGPLTEEGPLAGRQEYYRELWSFLAGLETRELGPVLVNFWPEQTLAPRRPFTLVLFIDCTATDASIALDAAGVQLERIPGTSLFRFGVAHDEIVLTLIPTASAGVAREWRYPRALVVGDRAGVEHLLRRAEQGSIDLGAMLRRAARVVGAENWIAMAGASPMPFLGDAQMVLLGMEASPTMLLAWTRGVTATQLKTWQAAQKKKMGAATVLPAMSATLALELATEDHAEAVRTSLGERLASFNLDVLGCDGLLRPSVLLAEPLIVSVGLEVLRTAHLVKRDKLVSLAFDLRRVELDPVRGAADREAVLAWSRRCVRTNPLVPADATLAARVDADIQDIVGKALTDRGLMDELAGVKDPTAILLPLIERDRRSSPRMQRIFQYMEATTSHPRQLARWVASGAKRLIAMTERIDGTGASAASGGHMLGIILSAMLVPGNLERVMDELSSEDELDAKSVAGALSRVVCNPHIGDQALWQPFMMAVTKSEYAGGSLEEPLILTFAMCVLYDPPGFLSGRLAEAWAKLPEWIRARLSPSVEKLGLPSSVDLFRRTVAALPEGDMKRRLSD